MASIGDIRVQESLKIKIAEAKNLPSSTGSGTRNSFCVVKLDNENIFQTSVIEKSLCPFYGEEFQGEIPRQFRFVCIYVYEPGHKHDKVLGKVTFKKEELYKYHGKDHWFPLCAAQAAAEVQGKVHVDIRFDECLNADPHHPTSFRLIVRVVECQDLTVINGACNPYAVISLHLGKGRSKEESKKTGVKKKTICPQFDDTFIFDLDDKSGNQDRHLYSFDDVFSGEIGISLWHDDNRVTREMLGGMYRGVFLGEVKILLRDLDTKHLHNAWYFLQAREWKHVPHDLGSLRLKIDYNSDHVFSSHYYDDLRNLLLQSPDIKPITSSAAYILGEIVTVNSLPEASKPLMKVLLQHGQLVRFVRALAEWEISRTPDSNTLFRGSTLVSKMVDDVMKLVGIPYLHDTLKHIIDEIFEDCLSCEIDPSKLKDGENQDENMEKLRNYVERIFRAITTSGLVCPTTMCEIFFTLKDTAMKYFPDSAEVKYLVVSAFIFLRFFAPAILGPKLFDLWNGAQNPRVMRTLTLISKAIQGLGNLVGAKTHSFGMKEVYMVPLFKTLADSSHIDSVKMYLDIISSAKRAHSQRIEAPIILKEGCLIKRAQGRKKFGLKNFKKRYFKLTNHGVSYSRTKDDLTLCEIPIEDILAVEPLQENSFRMKYMFQVVQPQRALYVQASNCVEERQWIDILTKVCNRNRHRLKEYHPAAFINGHWLCCKSTDHSNRGCTPVSKFLPVSEMKVDIDSEREIEKIHSLYLGHMEKLESMQEACASQEVYSGDSEPQPKIHIDDTKTCFETLNEILKCVISLEQEHLQYRKLVQREMIIGSQETPIGDDSYESYVNTFAQARTPSA